MTKTLKVQVVEMDKEMQQFAEDHILEAFDSYTREDVIANEIKKIMDK